MYYYCAPAAVQPPFEILNGSNSTWSTWRAWMASQGLPAGLVVLDHRFVVRFRPPKPNIGISAAAAAAMLVLQHASDASDGRCFRQGCIISGEREDLPASSGQRRPKEMACRCVRKGCVISLARQVWPPEPLASDGSVEEEEEEDEADGAGHGESNEVQRQRDDANTV